MQKLGVPQFVQLIIIVGPKEYYSPCAEMLWIICKDAVIVYSAFQQPSGIPNMGFRRILENDTGDKTYPTTLPPGFCFVRILQDFRGAFYAHFFDA